MCTISNGNDTIHEKSVNLHFLCKYINLTNYEYVSNVRMYNSLQSILPKNVNL